MNDTKTNTTKKIEGKCNHNFRYGTCTWCHEKTKGLSPIKGCHCPRCVDTPHQPDQTSDCPNCSNKKPFETVLVDDVKDPHCSVCGRELISVNSDDWREKIEAVGSIPQIVEVYNTRTKETTKVRKQVFYLENIIEIVEQELSNQEQRHQREMEEARRKGQKEGVRLVYLPQYDHSKCPFPQSCIGYMNAESDLEIQKNKICDELDQISQSIKERK